MLNLLDLRQFKNNPTIKRMKLYLLTEMNNLTDEKVEAILKLEWYIDEDQNVFVEKHAIEKIVGPVEEWEPEKKLVVLTEEIGEKLHCRDGTDDCFFWEALSL